MFIGIVQISSLATACIGHPLLTFEPYWTKLDVCHDSCSFKDTYVAIAYDKLESDCTKLCAM